MYSSIKDHEPVVVESLIETMKASKNEVQQKGMVESHIRDCAALFKYFSWLNQELKKGTEIDEVQGSEKLREFRAQQDKFIYPSFETISSIGANGADIHYKPEKETCKKINRDEIYLCDSGGQYYDGTTDITRTTHFGGQAPTAFQREMYTRVLMGNLDIEMTPWPKNRKIAGGDFDILARRPLWEVGLDYGHGTGHGVGSCLNVHEGPIGISKGYKLQFEIGMCVSNEPGYYLTGEFGIRLENIIMVVQHPEKENYLKWQNLDVMPYERELIDLDLISPKMRRYIDEFHQKCFDQLSPFMQSEED